MRSASSDGSALSIVVPVHDEAPNLPLLYAELREVLDGLGRAAEILFVDDGSTDGSAAIVRRLVAQDPRVRLVRLGRHAEPQTRRPHRHAELPRRANCGIGVHTP